MDQLIEYHHVSSTPSYELRWKSYEVHDIVMECSRLSLDPLESSCEDDMFSFREAPPSSCSSLLGPPPPSSPLPQLDLGSGEGKMSLPDIPVCHKCFSFRCSHQNYVAVYSSTYYYYHYF